MNKTTSDILHFVIFLIIACLVWLYYRRKVFPQTERYSTFGPRFWTGSVDACVLWPFGFALSVLLAITLPKLVAAVLIVAQACVGLIYKVFLQGKYGQTYGKMICKVKVVVYGTESPISYRRALLREAIPWLVGFVFVVYEEYALFSGAWSQALIANDRITEYRAFWILSSIPMLWLVAEIITLFSNNKRRALHDYIAGTIVVRTNISDETLPAAGDARLEDTAQSQR